MVDSHSQIVRLGEGLHETGILSELAMERVSKTYEGKAVAAFELGLEGVSVKETAQRLDINEHSVYTLRNRVKQSLLFEIRTITKELEG